MDTTPPMRRTLLSTLLKRLLVSFIVCLGVSAQAAQAQQPALPQQGGQPLTLDDCIRIGLEQQPALAAARASLAAAETNRHALDRLRLASLVSRELHVRKEQAALGVTIAAAGVQQAESETVYAVTRNYFSVLYARDQEKVVKNVLERLRVNFGQARRFFKVKGDPDVKVTAIDVDRLDVYAKLYELRELEALKGMELAKAALREAMGLKADCPLDLLLTQLPDLGAPLDLHQLTDLALSRRGELVQATTAAQVTDLEVTAQGTSLRPTFRTFAAVSDIHSRPIPQGVSNREYRPGAVGLDMPTTLAGRRHDRMNRARDFSARAAAVVDKTSNLIVLETEAAYLKWREADGHARKLVTAIAPARRVEDAVDSRAKIGAATSEEVIRAHSLQDQIVSQYNEARYLHALALAALERVTAGGFCPVYHSPVGRQP